MLNTGLPDRELPPVNYFCPFFPIDGLDIAEMGLHELRTKLTIIPQGKYNFLKK